MTINSPWFENGDDTAPPVESPLHRLFGDYHQTYDLFTTNHTLPFSLFFWERTSNLKIMFPSGKQYLFERYAPFNYIDNGYFLKFSEWIKQWFGITEIINSIPRPPRLELTFPILTNPCEVTYLTLDTTVRGVNVYSLIRESIDGEWEPRYPILVNSLTATSETGWSDNVKRYLLAENWVLPTRESVGLILDDTNQVGQSSTSIQVTTRQFETITEESFSCVNVRNSRYELFYYPRTEEGFNQATADREDFLDNPPEWLNSCTYQAISLSNETTTVSVGDIIFFEAVFDGVSDAPIPPDEPFYFWGYLRSDSDIEPCLTSITTNQVSGDFTSDIDVTYQSVNEAGDRYHYAISANHNYWLIQPTVEYLEGIEPCVYIAPGIEQSDFIFSLERCLGETISNSVYGTLDTNIDESKTYETFTYVWCNTGETITEERISSETIIQTNISSLTREPNNPNSDLILVSDTIVYADNYWLANNGREFNYTMPDSVRMKEIHAALNAGYFGNGQEKEVNTFGGMFAGREQLETLLTNATGFPDLPQPVNSLVDWQSRQIEIILAFLGLHNLPVTRYPTYQFFNGAAREADPVIHSSLFDLMVTQDWETQSKLGLWPVQTFNYARIDDDGQPEPTLYLGISDLLGDTYALDTRASVLMERAGLETHVINNNLLEVAKAIGSPFEEERIPWDYGEATVIVFRGGLGLAAGIASVSEQISEVGTTLFPQSFTDLINNRVQSIAQ